MTGTFPYYSDNVPGEKYGSGNYKATNGRLYKVSTSGTGTPLAWYPAPGRHAFYSGTPEYVGDCGYSLSSAPSGIGSVDLYFSTKHLNPQDGPGRACGLQLRCLSE